MGLVQSPHGPQFYMPDDLYVPTGDQPATLPQDLPIAPAQPGQAPGSPDGFQPSEDQKLLWAKAGGYATPSMEPIQVGQPAPPSPEVAAQLAAIPSAPTGPQAIPMHADSPAMGKALDTINGTAPAGVPSLAGAPTGGQLPSLAQTTSMGQAAINADKAATAAGTDAEVKAADAAQAEGVAGQQRLDQMEAQRRAAQAESERQHAIIDAHAAQLQKEADDYRIDPKAGYGGTGEKVGNLIAMALSGVGMALMGKGDQQNPVLAMINQHVKDSVDQQMDQRNQLQKRADRGLAAVDRFDQFSSNKNAQALAMQAAETQRIANKIKLAAGQYASASAKANGDKLIAGLDGQASKLWEGARQVAKAEADKAIEQKQAQQRIGLEGAAQAEHKREFDLNLDWQKQKDKADNEEKLALRAAAGKTASAATDKEIRELGIPDPSGSGEYILQPEGKALIAQAKQLRDLAAKEKDPARRQQLANQADATTEAAKEHVWKARNAAEGAAISDKLTGAQETVDITNKLLQKLDEDPHSWDRKTWAEIRSLGTQAKVAYGRANKGRLSENELEAQTPIFGPDPDSIWNRSMNIEQMKTALRTVRDQTLATAATDARGGGLRGEGWKPVSLDYRKAGDSDVSKLLSGRDAVDEANAATPDSVPSTIADRALHPIGDPNARVGRLENSYSTKSGLLPADEATVDTMIAKATAGDANDQKGLIAAATDSTRPGMANAVLSILKSKSPELYAQALDKLPDEERAARQQIDAMAYQREPIGGLVTAARSGDAQATDELTRRAAGGDRDAYMAVIHLHAASGRR